MSRYIPEYEISKKGSCEKPKIISQESFDKFKKSGLLRRFNWRQLPPPVEPPPIGDEGKTGSSLDGGSVISNDIGSTEANTEPSKKTTRKKK